VKYTPKQLGDVVRQTRRYLGATQQDLALTSGTGLRFIIDLEKGKSTCQPLVKRRLLALAETVLAKIPEVATGNPKMREVADFIRGQCERKKSKISAR
jgi:transcriptional regulator with XRE-family HTH domain